MQVSVPTSAALCLALLVLAPCHADDLDKQRCPRPTEFALVFSRGYGGDDMPKEDEKFEALLVKINAASKRSGLSAEAKAHLQDSADTLAQALAAKLQRAGT